MIQYSEAIEAGQFEVLDQNPEVFSGLDEMMAALSTETSCLNLIGFNCAEPPTLSTVASQLIEWQRHSPVGVTRVPYAAQRKNGERLSKFDLIERTGERAGKSGEIYSLTDYGNAGVSLSGHLLEMAYTNGVSLTHLFGTKIRRIPSRIDDDSSVLSAPLFRSLLLLAISNNSGDGEGIQATDIPDLPGIEYVDMNPDIKVGHAEDLGLKGFLDVKSKRLFRNGMPKLSNFFTINESRSEVVSDLENIISNASIIDSNWPVFINSGLKKAADITSNPTAVSNLLAGRLSSSQPGYEVQRDTAIQIAETLGFSGNFTTGDFRSALGGGHSVQHMTKLLTELTERGVIEVTGTINGTNRRSFGLVR